VPLPVLPAYNRGDMPSVLLLEFVKELDDAFILMEVLQQYGITLRQVRCQATCISLTRRSSLKVSIICLGGSFD